MKANAVLYLLSVLFICSEATDSYYYQEESDAMVYMKGLYDRMMGVDEETKNATEKNVYSCEIKGKKKTVKIFH